MSIMNSFVNDIFEVSQGSIPIGTLQQNVPR
ncbi:unnamed protein product [Acanthoscelides obtectus]|uniref:Uncharacterized protein n=1 Tax=Acanthoscelides obtectus TaxID=200917 RepID=A0A9P0QJL2_ACAOB|nr:unnamed protein product [Acanthoscelides obtectus]CAK1686386.1 hypothetical protein AOBTE_LOCUS35954 [Acanthoscelides obtectus]